MRRHEIPDVVIRRLPIYARTLRALSESQVQSISSEELGERIGVTAAQIRRDLSFFGKFGKQGKGYHVATLESEIARILHLDRRWDVALVGYGHLGRAIARYPAFEQHAFQIAAVFARNPDQIGQEVGGVVVLPPECVASVVNELGIQIGIVAVPAESAQEVANALIAGGVRALLNYAPQVLKVPDDVWVREVDPTTALQSLTYYLDDEPARPTTIGRQHPPEAADDR
ncbi:MAG TPA: redox-sensing transcriptional repressor Rex [Thermomicrobiaceae bacterium]|nr:redox-sensing transcriptional repressor Rex [Thermomicrobiaceae bacterium]